MVRQGLRGRSSKRRRRCLTRPDAAALADAFRKPGALDTECTHPMGDLLGSNLLQIRPTDVGVHSWDLARAIDAEEDLDPRLVDHALQFVVPNAERFVERGVFPRLQAQPMNRCRRRSGCCAWLGANPEAIEKRWRDSAL